MEKITMRDLFKGYTKYTEEEYKRIWENSIIVVDTNILLNFYRYSKDARKEIFEILKKLKSRLWIPYQVGKEFMTNKDNVMSKSYNEYESLRKKISNLLDQAQNEIGQRKSNQLKCKKELNEIIENTKTSINKKLNKESEEKNPNITDEIEEKILGLFNERIGNIFEEEEYKKVKEEGIRRFNEQIPPGYKDAGKEENGDYYIFYSMIKKSKEEKKDIIFITDDEKEDWFYHLDGKKYGGRYELLDEFYKETGNLLLMYTADGFVKSYNKNILNKEADENIISELKDIRKNERTYITNIYRNSNERNIALLENYRNMLIHSPEEINLNELQRKLFQITRSTNLDHREKLKYIRKISMIYSGIAEENPLAVRQKFIMLIEELIIYIKYSKSEAIPYLEIDIIKATYDKLINDLQECDNDEEKLKVYTKIKSNLKQHFNYINHYSHDMALLKIKNIIELIPNNLEDLKTTDDELIIMSIRDIMSTKELFEVIG